MDKKYYVLWIDDEYNKLSAVISDAEMDGILLSPFNTSKDGMKAFEESIDKWDAIILDAKGWNESSDETATTDGMHNSLEKIAELRHKRVVPVFIFSGQGDLQNDKEFKRSLGKRKLYKKGNKADQAQLFIDIKAEADKLVETQIRFKYADVIEQFPEIKLELIRIISRVHNDITNDKDIFTAIRKILEWVRKLCIAHGILPSEVKELNGFSKFLGDEKMIEYVPIYIQRSIHSCTVVSQEGSHRLSIDKAVKGGEAPYLIRSTVFELMNILYWCGSLSNNPNDIEIIRAKTSSFIVPQGQTQIGTSVIDDFVEGVVKQDSNRNYHCMEYLLSYSKGEELFGKTIKIKKYIENDKPQTKSEYPYFVLKYDIIK